MNTLFKHVQTITTVLSCREAGPRLGEGPATAALRTSGYIPGNDPDYKYAQADPTKRTLTDGELRLKIANAVETYVDAQTRLIEAQTRETEIRIVQMDAAARKAVYEASDVLNRVDFEQLLSRLDRAVKTGAGEKASPQ